MENNFVVLDDAENIIGVDEGNSSRLILENGSIVEFGEQNSYLHQILTLAYDKESRSLFSGDKKGHLVQYKVDTLNQTCDEVKNFGDLGIGVIISSSRFMEFVFFGGSTKKVRVLNLSTGELLPGHIETSIKEIYSLQVCVKSLEQIYLAVSGGFPDYSNDKTDLFDLSGFLRNDLVIRRKSVLEYLNYEIFMEQKKTNQSKADEIRKLTRERDEYKAKFNKMESKYNDLKEKYDNVLKEKKELIKTFNVFKKETIIKTKNFVKKMSILYYHKSTRTTIGDYNPVNRNGLFDETDPLVIIRDLKEDLKQEKHENRQLQNSMYNAIRQRREAEEETRRLGIELDTLGKKLDTIKEVVCQR